MSKVEVADTTPPDMPSGLGYIKEEDRVVIFWKEAKDKTNGSCVVYYNIYKDGKAIGRSYGKKYIFMDEPNPNTELEITAVNVNGVESERATIKLN